MTSDELSVLIGFLVGGLLTGIVAHWLDVLVAYVRGRW